ncbi:fibrillin-2-like [Montipora foliosa]|uniref:fibrillin-2-like n=1 Tax=Montipora foliosa TaxID=591990 RepID=UPI0035F158E6
MPVTLFTLYLIACMVASNTTGQQCKPSEVSIPGKALNGHTFKATVVSGPIKCQMLCENNPKCRSYNFHILTKNCELNDKTKETKPNDFATDELRFYMKREDIDECKVFTFTCDVNADCHNTDGSYICSCKVGYTGDGKTCTDIDECQKVPFPCDVKADCRNTEGSYICSCKPGYTGDGKTCTGYSEMMFRSPYKGKSINGTLGSSVTFSWSFSGRFSIITWGLADTSNPAVLGTMLVRLSTAGKVLVEGSYSQRVSGKLVANAFSGRAIFNISGIKREDAGFYTCELYHRQGYEAKTKMDHVKLIVK